ncbi:tail fiber domain-containing protein [Candidatus Woesearchaeota archaeon]|nr:tail fiber domain-containing protein [Candidatus Woesearchaeota archaeon]
MKNIMKRITMFFVLVLACVFLTTAYPNPGHSASQIGGGTFNDDGQNFYFPSGRSVEMNGEFHVMSNVGIGTDSPSALLDIQTVANGGTDGLIVVAENGKVDAIGGDGGGVSITSGDGGTCNDGGRACQGGVGGNIFLEPGSGGLGGFGGADGNTGNIYAVMSSGSIIVGDSKISSTYKIDVNGDIYASGTFVPSDLRFKTNIVKLSGVLDKIDNINGVYFDWKDKKESRQIGLIAQEVNKVYPELISTNEEGYMAMDYSKMTAVLVEAIKELKAENEALKKRVELLEKS